MRIVLARILILAFGTSFVYGGLFAKDFYYSPKVDSTWIKQGVFSKWNPSDPKSVHSRGIKILFFGSAAECGEKVKNGPVTATGNVHFQNAEKLTGVPLDKNMTQRWTPSADTPACPPNLRGQVGDSFVHINDDEANSGIGLFTHTGSGILGNDSFFRSIGTKGVNNKGTNAGIEGVFVTFKLDEDVDSVKPWVRGGHRNKSNPDAEFSVIQNLASYGIPSARMPDSKGHDQAKQQFVVALENKSCSKTGKDNLCKIKFLFNTALFRGGVVDLDKEKWFREGGVFLDPAQGGMPIVHGPIKGMGQTTKDKKSGLDLYKSEADPTQHQIFFDKQFKLRVTFQNLVNAMKISTSLAYDKKVGDINDVDLARSFGMRWNDPQEWYVTSVNFSQEVHNESGSSEVYLGGAIKEIFVGSAR